MSAATPGPMTLSGVRYQYAGARAWALDGIDITLGSGEIVAVVGANDAGKSTLALVACGLAPGVIGGRLEGTVELAGRETKAMRPYEAAQACGILFQNAVTQLSGTAHTVWEELAFGPRNIGLPIEAIVDRVESALVTLRLEELAARDPARLSGGQAQLVALAAVLTLQPTCLVLDEPTSQLDPEGTRLVGDAIRRLAGESGTGVLLIEHKTRLVSQIADRGVVLSGGRIALAGPIQDLLASDELTSLGVDPPPQVRVRRALSEAGANEDVVTRVAHEIRTEGLTR